MIKRRTRPQVRSRQLSQELAEDFTKEEEAQDDEAKIE